MNRKISVGMTVTIVILAMTVTFSITMLMAMRLFDHTVTSVKEKDPSRLFQNHANKFRVKPVAKHGHLLYPGLFHYYLLQSA